MMSRAELQARWAALQPRERASARLGATVLGLALLWWLALAPALQVMRQAPQQHRQLDDQLAHMQQLQAQAQALQKRPRVPTAEARRALEQSVHQQLGAHAQLQVNGSQATLTLSNLPADTLAQWLSQVRLQSQATVSQARLKRNSAASPATWNGSLMLTLPES